MYRRIQHFTLVSLLGFGVAWSGSLEAKNKSEMTDAQNSAQMFRGAEARIAHDVRHELVSLPYYGVFDNLEFQVNNGGEVTLSGHASRPSLKSDAQRVVERIEGVERVNNQIEVLPLSTLDDSLRARLYARIYGQSSLQKYTSNRGGGNWFSLTRWATGITNDPPAGYHAIHIIVNNGNIRLEGIVGGQMDKNIANIQANTVPGVFSVTNNLRVDG